jgi:predicted alpha/beta-hydrolase family hydrolase
MLVRPRGARLLLVLAHGAGAGMRHPFLEAFAQALAGRGVATWRYEFPYMAAGRGRVDPPDVCDATIRAAVAAAAVAAPRLPRVAGGKSFGGRMTSTAQARAPLDGVRGLVFAGFPLHPAGRPGTARADHLAGVAVPMLFLQGTRDELAPLASLSPVVGRLPRATLHVVDDADHGFHVRRKSGRDDDAVVGELAEAVIGWAVRTRIVPA